MERTSVRAPGGTLSVRTVGYGPAVLLVHGIPGSAATWDRVAGLLAAEGLRAVAPDLLGFGRSSRPAGIEQLGIDAQVDALGAVLATLDHERVQLVGHDYGSPIAVRLAHRHPATVERLVLAAGNLFTDTPIPPPFNAVNLPLVGGPLTHLLSSAPLQRLMLWIGVGRPRVRLDPDDHLGDPDQRRAIATILSASLRDLPGRYRHVEAALDELRQPTVVLWGDRDPFFPVEQASRAAAAIPDAELRIQPGAGHFLPVERPNAFVDAVIRPADIASGTTK